MNGLEREYDGQIRVTLINVLDRDTRPLQEKYGFTATPELFLVDQTGRVVGYWDTVESAEQLKQAIDEALK